MAQPQNINIALSDIKVAVKNEQKQLKLRKIRMRHLFQYNFQATNLMTVQLAFSCQLFFPPAIISFSCFMKYPTASFTALQGMPCICS